MDVDAFGRIAIAYHAPAPSGLFQIFAVRWRADLSSWEHVGASPEGVSQGTENCLVPNIRFDLNGNPIVGWNSAFAPEVFVRRWNPTNGAWEGHDGSDGPGGISANPGTSGFVKLAISVEGHLAACWTDNSSGRFEAYVRMSTVSTGGGNGSISVSSALAPVGTVVTATALFAGYADCGPATGHWTWGDGTVSPAALGGDGTLVGQHTYTTAGIYTLVASVENSWGLVAARTFSYVVIFDPGVGSVTGGGRVALVPDSTEAAMFGFEAHYNGTEPQGNLEFRSQSLSFGAVSVDWIVRDGSVARIQGSGRLNGDGDYAFLLTVRDVPGGDGLRLRIWDKMSGAVVYDTQPDQPLLGDNVGPLLQGAIVFHE